MVAIARQTHFLSKFSIVITGWLTNKNSSQKSQFSKLYVIVRVIQFFRKQYLCVRSMPSRYLVIMNFNIIKFKDLALHWRITILIKYFAVSSRIIRTNYTFLKFKNICVLHELYLDISIFNDHIKLVLPNEGPVNSRYISEHTFCTYKTCIYHTTSCSAVVLERLLPRYPFTVTIVIACLFFLFKRLFLLLHYYIVRYECIIATLQKKARGKNHFKFYEESVTNWHLVVILIAKIAR